MATMSFSILLLSHLILNYCTLGVRGEYDKSKVYFKAHGRFWDAGLQLREGCRNPMDLALTFDDGPNYNITSRLLDILQEEGVKATFFLLGYKVAAQEELVRRMWREGHSIGNHSWMHDDMAWMAPEAVQDDLERTNAVIEAALGNGYRIVYFRPPNGYAYRILNEVTSNFYFSFFLK